jgi:hypothetical protein
MASYTPRTEAITGASLSGSDGDANRTYTLANTGAIDALFDIRVAGAPLQRTVTFSLASDVITFLLPVWNDQAISLDYLTQTGTAIGGAYCTSTDVMRIMQIATPSGVTKPTDDQIEDYIAEVEDEIDRFTGHSWRTRYSQSTTGQDTSSPEYEYYDVPQARRYNFSTGWTIYLKHRFIKTFSAAAGDAIEIWNGSSWDDWLGGRTEGRANDYWVDYAKGALNIRLWIAFHITQAVRVKYRYGEAKVPYDVREACAMLVASRIIPSDDRSMALPETGDSTRMTHKDRSQDWEKRAYALLARRQELQTW